MPVSENTTGGSTSHVRRKMEIIEIKYAEGMEPLEQTKEGDLIDLRAAEDVTLEAGEFRIISLGVSMKLPRGYKAVIYPRSSTYKNFGIVMANSVGQVDSSYCGDGDVWGFPAIAFKDTVIHKGDRIAQFEIVPIQPKIQFLTVDHLGGEDRGGFGSTGVQ